VTLRRSDSLAAALYAAEHGLREAERRVEQVLTALFPDGWQGWAFTGATPHAIAIDVYEVIDSPAAARALIRAGFADVTLHGHPASKFITCACTTRTASP
jgi:hypothetical protein